MNALALTHNDFTAALQRAVAPRMLDFYQDRPGAEWRFDTMLGIYRHDTVELARERCRKRLEKVRKRAGTHWSYDMNEQIALRQMLSALDNWLVKQKAA